MLHLARGNPKCLPSISSGRVLSITLTLCDIDMTISGLRVLCDDLEPADHSRLLGHQLVQRLEVATSDHICSWMCRPAAVAEYVTARRVEGAADKTIRNELGTLRGILKHTAFGTP